MSDFDDLAEPAEDFGFAELAPGVDLSGLDGQQCVALSELLTRGNVTSAAETIGLDRSVVLYWIRNDSLFVAAFRAARGKLIEANEKRMAALAAAGPAAAAEAFASNEPEPPLALLRLLRLV
jgi:homoserine dehydrogenase